MNKNVLKIGALALGMFAFGATIIGTSNAATWDVLWQVSLTINTGTSECKFGKTLDLGQQAAALDTAYIFSGSFVGDQATWICSDREGGSGRNWVFTIQASDLTGSNGGTISGNNVSMKHSLANTSWDQLCIGGGAQEYTNIGTAPYTIMSRNGGVGVCQTSVSDVRLKVEIDENQAPGYYAGNITLTTTNIDASSY